MKKTLVAVAALVAVSGAMAEVTIGGNLNQAYTKSTVDGTSTSGLVAASAGSYVTFSGSEDLGSGLKASFKFEQGLALNNGDTWGENAAGSSYQGLFSRAADGSTASNREAWINLSGAFGSLTVGNQYTNQFLTIAAVDPNGVNNIVGLGSVATIAAISRPNAVTYALPSFVSGLNINAQYANGVNADGTGALDNTVSTTSGFGVNYSTGGLLVGYANETTGADKSDVWAASYNFGVAKVGFSQVTNKGAAATNSKDSTYTISAPVGDALTLAYSSGTTTVGADTSKNKNAQAGAYYSLSKRTQAYAIYGSTSNATTPSASSTTAFGINHAF